MIEDGQVSITDTLEAHELALIKVFSDDYMFQIPAYQRPYTWEEKHVEQLLDDLKTGYEDASATTENPPYFLGNIVLIKPPKGSDADVVDGQQRLTTLTMLLAVMRDLSSDAKTKSSIDKYIRQDSDEIAGTVGKYRIRLRPLDAEFFQKWVQNDAATEIVPPKSMLMSDSQERIIKNLGYLRKSLKELSEEQRRKLTSFVMKNCYLVVVAAGNRRAAYRIFSVMNSRGLDLSATDIFKAEIIGALPDEKRSDYTEAWEELEVQIGRKRFERLFAHIRMIHHSQKLRLTLEEEFRTFVGAQNRPAQFIDTELVPMARAYRVINDFDFKSAIHAKAINKLLKQLARIDYSDWEPAAVLYISRHEENAEKILSFLMDLDRLAHYLFICGANINKRIQRYAQVIKTIKDNGMDVVAAGSPLQLSSTEKAEMLEELDGSIYTNKRIRLAVLLRLDEALSSDEATYDRTRITVEHVLPQNPPYESEWRQKFNSDEVHDEWVNRAANLVLLARNKNASASNEDFETKKKIYFTKKGVAPYAITSQVNAEKTWTPRILKRRQEQLLGVFKELWRL
jgi:hypothetical protein